MMLRKPALQAVLRIADRITPGALSCSRWICTSGTTWIKRTRSRASERSARRQPPLRVAAPADNGEIRADNLVEQRLSPFSSVTCG
jgi:hypothetical protein